MTQAERCKRYYKANKTEILERRKKHYLIHRAEIQEYNKMYNLLCRAKITEQKKNARRKFKERDPMGYTKYLKEYDCKRRYGITAQEYDNRKAAQSFRCMICGSLNKKLVLDHNHLTGQVRGFLCCGCNRSLCNYENEDVRRPFLEYLKRFKEN